MSLFVITDQSTSDETLNTPVFACGENSQDSAVAVFTRSSNAEEYIRAAGWASQQQPAQLSPIEAAKWLVLASENEVSYVFVDPERNAHLRGEPQEALPLEEPLAVHTELLKRIADLTA